MEYVEDILADEMNKLAQDVRQRHIAAGQKATGRTAAAFEGKARRLVGQLLGLEHSGVLVGGRGSGDIPYDFENVLMEWAEAKGISFSSNEDKERFARALAWKIRNEGTKLFRSKIPEDIFQTPINDMMKRIGNRLTDSFTSQIKGDLDF